MSKVLRIDLQGSWNYQVYEDKEDLRTALIDIHETDMDNEEDKETLKTMPLDEICEMFMWDYEIITDEEAKEREK
tara:strand:+ start:272 stop:496 length:225 start_codon:yes stop_codon:yes gene_type:complete